MNMLKPKNTALNPKAKLYKRFIGLEQSTNLTTGFVTESAKNEVKYWYFDKLTENFVEVSTKNFDKVIVVNSQVFVYKDKKYKFVDGAWAVVDDTSLNLLSIHFAPTRQYQTNKYYYVGNFDYMIKGGIEGTTSQRIKGSVLPLSSFNIRYYTDDLQIDRDDIIVIEDSGFIVEDTEVVQKRMPKVYNIYSSTLNNIL